jgi:ADP-dependent NAD(P)H-hydrate dehydratase
MPGKIKTIRKLPTLPPRRADCNKGTLGRALIVGGSLGMMGAVSLSANAALRGGAGLVEFAAPACVQQAIAMLCPCAISTALACKANGQLDQACLPQLKERMELADVIAIGPGLGTGTIQQNMVQLALEQDKPVVIDADGLNNLTKLASWPAMRRCSVVMTPHPGEFARLTGMKIEDIQADRQKVAAEKVSRWAKQAPQAAGPLVLLLKGHGTVVTDGEKIYVNRTSNPGMAVGGTGDVLTGLVAAFVGQGLSPFDAASLGAYCHGLSGDLAAAKLGQISLIATDLLDFLPQAIMKAQRA